MPLAGLFAHEWMCASTPAGGWCGMQISSVRIWAHATLIGAQLRLLRSMFSGSENVALEVVALGVIAVGYFIADATSIRRQPEKREGGTPDKG